MTQNSAKVPRQGRVASLHLHPLEPGTPLQTVSTIDVVEQMGVSGEPRYFGRKSRGTGEPSRRQVTLIEREQLVEHATTLGLEKIKAGAVRSNIETEGIELLALIGRDIRVGQAVLRFYAPRDPCYKMDAVCQGLRELMMNRRQGVLAEVIKSGKIAVGDAITPL